MITLKNASMKVSGWKESTSILEKGIQQAIQKTAVYTVGQVKLVITKGTGMWKKPIDTGQMRQGIQMISSGRNRAKIGPSHKTDYAVYVHDGTSKMRARPFFDITADKKKRDIVKFFQGEINKTVKNIAKRIG